jgi:transposase InsO family protein
METGFVLDALEQSLYARRPVENDGLIHHSDRGVQYISIQYTERPAEAGIEPSAGSVGDSYENALAESVIRLFESRGAISTRSNTPRSNRSIGPTTGACSS